MTKLTYQQLLGLDEARTQGEWVAGKTARNPRKGIFVQRSRLDAELPDGTTRDLATSVYESEIDEANFKFIAAAPQAIAMLKRYREGLQQIIAEAIEHWPDAENWPVIQDMQALLDDKEG